MVSLTWWIVFNVFVLAMLVLDLTVFHRKSHQVKIKEALIWSAVWIAMALVFNAIIYFSFGQEKALAFLSGYLIEKSLSVDNLFVFLMLFSYFRVPSEYQHKVLFWGILGAIVMRALFIAAGVALIEQFHFIIYVFGGFLIYTGLKMAFKKDEEVHPEKNIMLRAFKKFYPTTAEYHGDKFFIKEGTKRFATPLFVVLLLIETTDLIFAVDSIPAILAITTDSFIVYTSNIFAILGLRALYFALSGVMGMFRFLHYGLAGILVFVGVKMCVAGFYKVPVGVALAGVAGILFVSVAASLLFPAKKKEILEGEKKHL